MVVHSEKEAHVVRLTQQLELLVAHPERVGQIVRTPAPDTNSRTGIYFFLGGKNEINLIAMHNIINYELNGQKTRKN